MGYAAAWGCGSLGIVNLFALRSVDPDALREAADPVGDECDAWIGAHCENADLVVAAWASTGGIWGATGRWWLLRDMGKPLACLGLTRRGAPRHTLYLRKDTPVMAYMGGDRRAWGAPARSRLIPPDPGSRPVM